MDIPPRSYVELRRQTASPVTLNMNPTRKISVLLPEEEAGQFDKYCQQLGYKKSTLIVRLIREHLEKQGFQPEFDLSGGDEIKRKRGIRKQSHG